MPAGKLAPLPQRRAVLARLQGLSDDARLTTAEVAALLGVARVTVTFWRYYARGHPLRWERRGHFIEYRWGDVKAYLRARAERHQAAASAIASDLIATDKRKHVRPRKHPATPGDHADGNAMINADGPRKVTGRTEGGAAGDEAVLMLGDQTEAGTP